MTHAQDALGGSALKVVENILETMVSSCYANEAYHGVHALTEAL